jgi:diguanylate cyclase (GGDEF)-like protein
MKILIAEDDENSRHLLEDVLTSEGYEVASFDNGLKALSYLQIESADLIISDILMPELDGYGLCRALKQNIQLQKIPFIFYTATYTTEQDERFAIALGANKFLIKPMLMPDFLKVVKQLLDSKELGQSPKNRGLYRGSPLKLDKQHADLLRGKLDKKLIELNEEKSKLIESEARFRDFAEASADWFWESNEKHKINALAGGPTGLNFYTLIDLAEACHSHSSNEMLKTLQSHKRFSDYVVHFTDELGKLVYLRVSGKPLFELNGNFIGYRGVGRDVSEMVALNRKVEFLASHDDLTGLPNRSLFRQRLEHAIAKAERTNSQVLLLFFDLDKFKLVNDTLGHEAGDQLLIMATKRISEKARATDALCRLGGDEFVMVMEGASPQDGHRLVRDIITAFSSPFEIKQQKVYCTTSIGVSVYPDDTTDPQTLMVYADLAMYRAKQNGRNDFEFYTSNLNFIAHQWLDMENGIREAFKEDQFFVVFQPQFENTKNQLIGMEVLLRWRHPQRGLIPPLEFIKIAEQSSLINQIGEFITDAACKQIRIWLDKGLQVPRVSFNISARHLRSQTLVKTLTETTLKYGVEPSMLCIEITEHALLEEGDVVKKNMREIKAAGFSISLDDFGMGHSSLLYLKRWAVDEVKIDRSFVDGLLNSAEDRVIVKAIVALGDALSLQLVGEGVENQMQADILAASGCKNVQGYFYSPPIEAKEMETWLKKNGAKKLSAGTATH